MSNTIFKERHGVTRALAKSLGVNFKPPTDAPAMDILFAANGRETKANGKESQVHASVIDVVRDNPDASRQEIEQILRKNRISWSGPQSIYSAKDRVKKEKAAKQKKAKATKKTATKKKSRTVAKNGPRGPEHAETTPEEAPPPAPHDEFTPLDLLDEAKAKFAEGFKLLERAGKLFYDLEFRLQRLGSIERMIDDEVARRTNK